MRTVSGCALRVNILGVTLLDFADASIADKQRALLAKEGIEVVFDGISRFDTADIAAMAHADASIAATWGRLASARALRDGAGFPTLLVPRSMRGRLPSSRKGFAVRLAALKRMGAAGFSNGAAYLRTPARMTLRVSVREHGVRRAPLLRRRFWWGIR